LLAGLGIDLEGFATLARRLATYLTTETGTLNPTATNEDDRYFLLSEGNPSLLYRHARLARLLRLTVDELFQVIGIAGIGAGLVTNAADLLAVVEADKWRRESGYTLDDIAVATGGTPRDTTHYLDPATTAANIVTSAAQALSFGDTIFSVSLGITEQSSRELSMANVQILEQTADGDWQILAGTDLASAVINIPATATIPVPPNGSRAVTTDEVRGVLQVYEPAAVLSRALGAAIGFDAVKIEALARLAGTALHANGLSLALRGSGPIDPLRI
jgi:hypothetical protein